jgi:hypothetical protein
MILYYQVLLKATEDNNFKVFDEKVYEKYFFFKEEDKQQIYRFICKENFKTTKRSRSLREHINRAVEAFHSECHLHNLEINKPMRFEGVFLKYAEPRFKIVIVKKQIPESIDFLTKEIMDKRMLKKYKNMMRNMST